MIKYLKKPVAAVEWASKQSEARTAERLSSEAHAQSVELSQTISDDSRVHLQLEELLDRPERTTHELASEVKHISQTSPFQQGDADKSNKTGFDLVCRMLKEISDSIVSMAQKVADFDQRLTELEQQQSHDGDSCKKRKVRRKAHQICKRFVCDVNDCCKAYGSEASLGFHMKLKHHNEALGSKHKLAISSDRENLPSEYLVQSLSEEEEASEQEE